MNPSVSTMAVMGERGVRGVSKRDNAEVGVVKMRRILRATVNGTNKT